MEFENFNSDEWFIIYSDKLETKHKCICGHYVKRMTYVYHQTTKTVIMIGTSCLKKYNIHQHLQNVILFVTLKEHILNIVEATSVTIIHKMQHKENICQAFVRITMSNNPS